MPIWSNAILERHIAPGIGDFTGAQIDDLEPEFEQWRCWCANHFLNSACRCEFTEPLRQYALNFIRRAQTAFRFYHDARNATLSYLDGDCPTNPSVEQYYRALALWEMTFVNWSICLDLVKHLSGKDPFAKGDGSSRQRAYDLHNTIKHHANDIRSGRLAGDDNVAFWLTNEGFRSKTVILAYSELADLVRSAATAATDLQDPDSFTRQQRNQSVSESP